MHGDRFAARFFFLFLLVINKTGTGSHRSALRVSPQLGRDDRVPRSSPVPLTQGRSPAARPRALLARSIIG